MHTSCIIHHSCKEENSVKQRNMPIWGPIQSDPVIRPDPVNTRTPGGGGGGGVCAKLKPKIFKKKSNDMGASPLA